MRNVLVVLVLSCIGLSCGFIVPSGIRELIEDLNKSANSIQYSHTQPRNMIKSKKNNSDSLNIMVTLELLNKPIEIRYNSNNNSLDGDLYENNSEKNTTIEERSFIYIKPRGKTPYLKNVFELLPKANVANKAIKSHIKSHPILEDISRRLITENTEHKFPKTYVGQSNNDEYQTKLNNFIDTTNTEPNYQIEKISNKVGEYVELLKAPLVRPVFKTNESHFVSMEKSLFNFTIGRKPIIDIDIKESLSNNSVSKLKNDWRFESKNTYKYKNYDKGLTVSDESFDDGNLDEIVKRLLGNQILERKYNHVDHNGFHFCRDCIKKSKNQTVDNRLKIKSRCKCGRSKLLRILGNDIGN